MSDTHHLALPAGQILGKYRIERVLGSGGFAITYLAVDTNLDRKVAIKELMPADLAIRLPDLSVAPRSPAEKESFEWARSRFLDEARNIARFEHPNLVRVFEHFEVNSTAYIVMSYVEGDDLNDYLKGVVPAPVETLVRLIDPLLGGLRVMHRSGFLHRDIKPDNIRITPEGVPILIDFGSARHAIGSRTKDLTTILTPRYAPLEQYSEKGNVGPWTDLYSLACVVHKTLRGTAPPEATERERNDPYLPLIHDVELSEYPRSLLAAVDTALNPHEAKRPQSAEEWRSLLWQEIDLPTGFTRIPSGRNVPPAQTHSNNPQPPAMEIPARKSNFIPVYAVLGVLAILAIAAGGLMLAIDHEPVPPNPTIPEPVLEKTEESSGFANRPPEPHYEIAGATHLYKQGDRLFRDIADTQFKRHSAADSLDGFEKGIDKEGWDERTVATVRNAIKTYDIEIETFSKDAIEALQQLVKYPESLREKGFLERETELTLAKTQSKVDTSFQASLLHVFRGLEPDANKEIRIGTDTIKERVWEAKLKDMQTRE